MNRKSGNAVEDRLKIQEKALASLADAVRKREAALDEELADILRELKALKLYLSRYAPGFEGAVPLGPAQGALIRRSTRGESV